MDSSLTSFPVALMGVMQNQKCSESTSSVLDNFKLHGWSNDFGGIATNKDNPAMKALNWDHKMATCKNKVTGKKTDSIGIGWNGHLGGKNTNTGTAIYVFGRGLWTPNPANCQPNCEAYPLCSCVPGRILMSHENWTKIEKGGIRASVIPPSSSLIAEQPWQLNTLSNDQNEDNQPRYDEDKEFAYETNEIAQFREMEWYKRAPGL